MVPVLGSSSIVAQTALQVDSPHYTGELPRTQVLKNLLLAALLLLYLFSLGRVGFGLDPDEPRYASIGREMARSGDWITPRLNGSPWFEKPPLLYWMTATATNLGLRDEWAARLPVALLSLAFLMFFYSVLEREFSARVALMALAILGTSAGWLAYSFASVTDLPMSVCLVAAMLVALFDTRRRTSRGWIAGILLGFAILAKAFLPVALFFPVWLIARGKRLAIAAAAMLTAGPWHLLVWLRNGSAFWDVYFWQQQVGRFNSPQLHHGRPFWFYIPVLLLGLFPWTPLFALLARRKIYDDVRVSSLAIWLALALAFLSAFSNKLPGYSLSLLPAAAIVLAVALDKAPRQEWWIAACALLLILLPSVAGGLPSALLEGATRVPWTFLPSGLLFLPGVAAVWILAWRKQPALAILAAALVSAAGVEVLEIKVMPALDQRVSVRAFWLANQDRMSSACLGPGIRPASEYALDYYASRAILDCGPVSRQERIVVAPGGLSLEEPPEGPP
jgi:4-amino-4-deoxy-L-arabinose transferase-like glycosyltransferase